MDPLKSYRVGTDGSMEDIKPPAGCQYFPLRTLQEYVDGYITTFRTSQWPNHICVANDEGMLMNYPRFPKNKGLLHVKEETGCDVYGVVLVVSRNHID